MKKLVIFDWAGTTVDFGCFAPVAAFIGAFEQIGITATIEQARKPMGMLKRDHVRTMFEMPELSTQFEQKKARQFNDNDVNDVYQHFETLLFASLEQYTAPIPGVIELVNELRTKGLAIGSTTGYTKEMMDVVAPSAATHGYQPDFMATAGEGVRGRPHADMILLNMTHFSVEEPHEVIKVGDTISDVLEGVNANVTSVAVIKGSSELGLTEAEHDALSAEEKETVYFTVRQRFIDAGADYVIDDISQLGSLI